MDIIYLATIDSTNLYAQRNLSRLADRTVIVADYQTKGYGRCGRKWFSGIPSNCYMSIVLTSSVNQLNPKKVATITHYTSVVLIRVLERYKVRASIRWPNDILVEKKKIAGILAESTFRNVKVQACIIGVGMNLNMRLSDLQRIDQPATSLNLLVGKGIDRNQFVDFFIGEFFSKWDGFVRRGFDAVRQEYIDHCEMLGKMVTARKDVEIVKGIAETVLDDGALVIQRNSGIGTVVYANDVSLSV